jgi:hypothetical protein
MRKLECNIEGRGRDCDIKDKVEIKRYCALSTFPLREQQQKHDVMKLTAAKSSCSSENALETCVVRAEKVPRGAVAGTLAVAC